MARRVVGLDLGAYSVKLVRLESGKQVRFEIIDVVEEVLPHDEPEQEKDLLEKQRDALASLNQRGLLDAEMYSIGLSALDGQMRTMQVPFAENRKIQAVLPGLLDAEIPFELDDMVVSWYRVDNGPNEDSAESKIRLAFGKKPAIAQTLHMLQTFSINPRLMHLSSAAPYEIARELSAKSFLSRIPMDERTGSPSYHPLFAMIDFGHNATNVCVFDEKGYCFSRSYHRGGKKLTEEIAQALDISFKEAEEIKHGRVNLLNLKDESTRLVNQIALKHHLELAQEITRAFISARTNGLGEVRAVALVGGGSLLSGLFEYSVDIFKDHDISVVLHKDLFPSKIEPSQALAFAYGVSTLNVHAKANRFNFRKDEFSWRGDLDVFRAKSTPLILWSLTLVCSMILLWSANSLVLGKENKHIESQLKQVCSSIIGKNVESKKCLSMMKEQISTSISVGIPEYTASDIYLKAAEFIPSQLNVTVTELDISDKKVRMSAEVPSFTMVDEVEASFKKVPCLRGVEKGRAQQAGSVVKFTVSADIDCNPASKAPARI